MSDLSKVIDVNNPGFVTDRASPLEHNIRGHFPSRDRYLWVNIVSTDNEQK